MKQMTPLSPLNLNAVQPQSAGITLLRMILVVAVCFTTLIAFDHEAHADKSDASLVSVTPTFYTVVSNSERYSGLMPAGPLLGSVRVTADAEILGRIKKFCAWINLLNLDADTPDLIGGDWAFCESYRVFRRPKKIDRTVSVFIPEFALQWWLPEQCNRLADRLREAGWSEREIHGQDHYINVDVLPGWDVLFTAPFSSGSEVKPVSPDITLMCKKFPGAEGPGFGDIGTEPPRVEAAVLSYEAIAGFSGVCNLILYYGFRTSAPNTEVKFRFWETDKNLESELMTVTTGAWGVAFGEKAYTLENQTGAENGSIRIRVESPNNFLSNGIDYLFVCHTPPAGGLTANPVSDAAVLRRENNLQAKQRQALREFTDDGFAGRLRGVSFVEMSAEVVDGECPCEFDASRFREIGGDPASSICISDLADNQWILDQSGGAVFSLVADSCSEVSTHRQKKPFFILAEDVEGEALASCKARVLATADDLGIPCD
jgi:hypothetical protein